MYNKHRKHLIDCIRKEIPHNMAPNNQNTNHAEKQQKRILKAARKPGGSGTHI